MRWWVALRSAAMASQHHAYPARYQVHHPVDVEDVVLQGYAHALHCGVEQCVVEAISIGFIVRKQLGLHLIVNISA